MRRSCFPNSSSHQHGPPLLGRVRMPPRSPTSTLVCSPPTPSLPSVAAPVVPRQRPTPVRRTCSSPLHRCPRQPVQRRRLFYPGSPCAGSLPDGETRGSQVPGPSSSCVPWSKTPPGATAPRPLSVRSPSPSGVAIPWTPGICLFRGCSTHGPHARVPTHRRNRYRLQRKARYRPGGLTLGRAGFAPAG